MIIILFLNTLLKIAVDKKKLCPHVGKLWDEVQKILLENDNLTITVKMEYFEKVKCLTQSGKETDKLVPMPTDPNMHFVINSIEYRLSKILFYRDHLKHDCDTIHTFKDTMETVVFDVDFEGIYLFLQILNHKACIGQMSKYLLILEF